MAALATGAFVRRIAVTTDSDAFVADHCSPTVLVALPILLALQAVGVLALAILRVRNPVKYLFVLIVWFLVPMLLFTAALALPLLALAGLGFLITLGVSRGKPSPDAVEQYRHFVKGTAVFTLPLYGVFHWLFSRENNTHRDGCHVHTPHWHWPKQLPHLPHLPHIHLSMGHHDVHGHPAKTEPVDRIADGAAAPATAAWSDPAAASDRRVAATGLMAASSGQLAPDAYAALVPPAAVSHVQAAQQDFALNPSLPAAPQSSDSQNDIYRFR
jgi:hypothetical protein